MNTRRSELEMETLEGLRKARKDISDEIKRRNMVAEEQDDTLIGRHLQEQMQPALEWISEKYHKGELEEWFATTEYLALAWADRLDTFLKIQAGALKPLEIKRPTPNQWSRPHHPDGDFWDE